MREPAAPLGLSSLSPRPMSQAEIRIILPTLPKPCHSSVARFPHSRNLATAAWHTFHTSETLPQQRGILFVSADEEHPQKQKALDGWQRHNK